LAVSAEKTRAVCARIVRLLYEERKRRGLSKYALAARSGLSQQMISYVERGLRYPSLETTLRIADALEVDFAKIVKKACKVA
jgi:transcriptional regulator with XRE-family HTH domain